VGGGEVPELHPAQGGLYVVAGEALRAVEGLGPEAAPSVLQIPIEVLGEREGPGVEGMSPVAVGLTRILDS
jgi:hypothetical protein